MGRRTTSPAPAAEQIIYTAEHGAAVEIPSLAALDGAGPQEDKMLVVGPSTRCPPMVNGGTLTIPGIKSYRTFLYILNARD